VQDSGSLAHGATGMLVSAAMAKRKNPHAVALGRKGGFASAGRGAAARFAAMTPEERRALARKAARARWRKTKRVSQP